MPAKQANGAALEQAAIQAGTATKCLVDVRKHETKANGDASFALKPGDAVFSDMRPGAVYLRVTKYKDVLAFKAEYKSHYKKVQDYTDDQLSENGRKVRSDKGKKRTKVRSDKGKKRAKVRRDGQM